MAGNTSSATAAAAAIDTALSSIQASATTLGLLRDLHTQALAEPGFLSSTGAEPLSAAADRFVALDPDKCALVYLLLRATGARFVVEAGTSFGLSTVYLALAVGQNVGGGGGGAGGKGAGGKVIATEKEPHKAARARRHWAAAAPGEVEPWIELREGDLRETLRHDLPEQVDFVLLDIWTPLALPALSLVQPRLRVGATIVVDNFIAAAEGYKDLRAYLDDPRNGFKVTTAPYDGGLCIAVYTGAASVVI